MDSPDRFLAWTLVGLGVLGLVAGLGMRWFPSALRRGWTAFPRSRAPGWILAAVGVFWVAWVVQHAALGRFEGLKPFIPFAAVGLFGAMVYFLDELLAPRALGGLLLLVANPVLMGVRWAESAWRIVPVLFAYAWVVFGCALMLHPWVFRKLGERLLGSDAAVARMGWGKLLGGAVLLAAGVWHLR
jgi:hypothetical protein